MKFVEVDRDGNFSLKGDLRVLYSTMLFTRCQLLSFAPLFLSSTLTIATRYALVRR
jgi:hypothetical protein